MGRHDRAGDYRQLPTESVEIVERKRSLGTQAARATIAGLAAGAAAMAIDDTGYWAALAAALAAGAAVLGIPSGAAKAEAPLGEVKRMRESQQMGHGAHE
jgi:hypothetical protein